MVQLRCVNNVKAEKNLTVGKIYRGTHTMECSNGTHIQVHDDMGCEIFYLKTRFEEVMDGENKDDL
jgi:hypothetical protein